MLALDDVDVITFENGVSAPLCTRLLGDLGAEVIKVERPGTGDVNRQWDTAVRGESAAHVYANRNKRSIELDLKSSQGREIALELSSKADVVVQNFSPGVLERLGVGYDDVAARNDDVIYLNISGYGSTGPYSDRRAYDLVMQGETGLILMTGSPDEPAKLPVSVCDISAGMYGTMSILTALYHRKRTGHGQKLEVDMFSSVLSWLSYLPLKYWYQGDIPQRVGMRHHLLTPYGPFETADEEYVNFAVLSEAHWRRFCEEIVDRPGWVESDRFESNEKRVRNRDVLEPMIEEIIETMSREELIEKLEANDIPWGNVNTLDEVLSHPVVEERDLIYEMETKVGDVKVIKHPMGFGAVDVQHNPMPDLGEDTDDILDEIGLTPEEIEELDRSGVI